MPDQHFNSVSSLWLTRDLEVTGRHYFLQNLVDLDVSISQHLNALKSHGEDGWLVCSKALEGANPGEIFAATVLAFESAKPNRIDRIVEAISLSQSAFRGAVSALAWIDDTNFRSIIIDLVSKKTWQHRSLGLAACGTRRVNPRAYLNQAAESSNLYLKLCALKSAGQLNRLDMLPVLQDNFQNSENSCKFEAARSALMLGDRSALGPLGSLILSRSRFARPAMQVALRVADSATSHEWIKTLSRNPKFRREMLEGVAITGNIAYVPMLIKQMYTPELARAAGDALSIITGVDITESNLAGSAPDDFESAVNETDADKQPTLDPDENLVWPDVERVADWWQNNADNFSTKKRFLAGKKITAKRCKLLLRNGCQWVRDAAALELALANEKTRYFNVKANGALQMKRLSKMDAKS